MTKDLCTRMRYEDLERAYAAYNVLMAVYENTCGGPYGARQYKEYFAISDSRDKIRHEVINRSNTQNDGDRQKETKRGSDK